MRNRRQTLPLRHDRGLDSGGRISDLCEMAHVTITAALSRYTYGKTEIEYPNVATIKQLIRAFSEEFPDIKPHLEEGAAFAIDGQLFQDSLLEPIQPDSEVHILPQIGGG